METRKGRREFLKKAGIATGVGAVGAATLNKEYVKPLINVLEPCSALAQTPAYAAQMTWAQNSFLTTPDVLFVVSTLNIVLDVPGFSPPVEGTTLDMSINVAVLSDDDGSLVPPSNLGVVFTLPLMQNVATVGPGGTAEAVVYFDAVQFTIFVNGVQTQPAEPNPFVAVPAFSSGDQVHASLNILADATTTTGGNPVPALFVATSPPVGITIL